MMKKTTVLSILLLFALSIIAGNRSKKEMRDIAASALATYGVDGKVTRAHSIVEPKLESETGQYAIYSDEVGGFVIVSKRDDVRPVLGRSLGKYDAANIPDGLQWWLEATEAALKSGARASEDADILKVSEPVDNFVTTLWKQSSPYNSLCPKDKNDNVCLTGCGATAMAMAINYFKYPDAGTGTGWYSVQTPVNGADPIIESFDNVPIDGQYKWDKMKDSYSNNETAKEVATLMFDCGKSVDMKYSASGSGSKCASIPHALAYNFSYDSLSVNHYFRNYFSDKEWFTFVRNELENKRPIIYSGTDLKNGGHTFLLTGINTDGMVYINWGWGGLANGWFAIDNLYIDKLGYYFAYNQEIVVGLNPQKTPAEGLENTSVWSFSPNYNFALSSNARNELLVNSFFIFNLSWRWFVGELRLIIETEEETPKTSVIPFNDPGDYYYMAGYQGVGVSGGLNISQLLTESGKGTFKFPQGFYRVYFQKKSVEESDWQLIRKYGGNYYCYFSVAADGTVKVDNENSLSGIHDVIYSPASNAQTTIYSIDGRKLDSTSSSNVVIMKNGKDVRKVINVNR